MNNKGEKLGHLKPQDFQVQVGGKQVEVLSANVVQPPVRVVVVVDSSGSMREQWKHVIETAIWIPHLAPENWSVGVVLVNDAVRAELAFSETRENLIKKLAAWLVQPQKILRGRTALFDGIARAMEFFGEPQFGDSLVVVTDGVDTFSKMRDTQIQERLAARGIRVFGFWVPDSRFPFPHELGEFNSFRELVEKSGGFMVTGTYSSPGVYNDSLAFDRKQAERGVAAVMENMGEFYLIELGAGVKSNKPQRLKIKVSRQTGSIKLYHAEKLIPCQLK